MMDMMMRSRRPVWPAMVAGLLIAVATTAAMATSVRLAAVKQGVVKLTNTTDYKWWYGCAPTAAGMVVGHYDRNGYGGQDYGNLVPGGLAESSTYGAGPYLANDIVASGGHIADFYGNAAPSGEGHFGLDGDDVPIPSHDFDCLADFMGTSQDAYGHTNGATSFWFDTAGSPLTVADLHGYGPSYYDKGGMYGIYEYLDYRGYGSGDPSTDTNLFNQFILGYDWPGDEDGPITQGFTFDDYRNEIDAGRPVMIHVDGHAMYGYGYDNGDTQTVLLHDTWTEGQHSMVWGGSYSGRAHLGVTVVKVTTGSGFIPEPLTMIGVLSGVLGLGAYVRRRRGAPQ